MNAGKWLRLLIAVRLPRRILSAFYPAHRTGLNIIVVRQNAADPNRGGLPVSERAHPLSLQILGPFDASLAIDENVAVAEDARRKHRQRNARKHPPRPQAQIRG